MIAWIVAGIVLLGCGLAGAGRQDDQSTSYQVGAALGAILLPLVVAGVLWKLGTTLARRRRPLLHPWMGIIAAVIGIIALFGRTSQERAEAAATVRPGSASTRAAAAPRSA